MKRILVVDDEESVRETIVRVLRDEGFEVIEASDGETAFDLAVQHVPDLIITDVVMDDPNGFILKEWLEEDARTASIPLILMTGVAGKAGAWRSDSDIEYLDKPFSVPELLAAVAKKM